MNTNPKEFQNHLASAYAAVCVLLRNKHMDPEIRNAMEECKRYFNTRNAIELSNIIGEYYETNNVGTKVTQIKSGSIEGAS